MVGFGAWAFRGNSRSRVLKHSRGSAFGPHSAFRAGPPCAGHQRRGRSMAVVEGTKPSLPKKSAAPALPARSTQVMFGSAPMRRSTSACPMPRLRCNSATTTMDTYPLETPSVIARAKPTTSSSATATIARCEAAISRPSSLRSPTRWAHPLVVSRRWTASKSVAAMLRTCIPAPRENRAIESLLRRSDPGRILPSKVIRNAERTAGPSRACAGP